jgi:hypothetical protein
MRTATEQEFAAAVARAGWPAPRRMTAGRCFDAYYSDRGTDVASKHEVTTRGKVTSTTYMVNPAYLPAD